MRVGVLSVQGNLREHAQMLRGLGADVVEVRKPAGLDSVELFLRLVEEGRVPAPRQGGSSVRA